MFFLNKKKKKMIDDLNPDEIFIDDQNLPGFDTYQFEGRIEKPISRLSISLLASLIFIIMSVFLFKIFFLQVWEGQKNAEIAENNRLRHTLVFADRGIIYDRSKIPLVWNEEKKEGDDWSVRKYYEKMGFSSLLGFVKYPQKDKQGFYFKEDIQGIEGLEKKFENYLKGQNGVMLIETDALDQIVSKNIMELPQNGNDLMLTIDSRIQEKFFELIKTSVDESGFFGGAGVILDITNGDIVAMISYPEYDSNIMSDGTDEETIKKYTNDPKNPFLNRVLSGLYTPGSTVKPFVAMAGLTEKVITPETIIVSTEEMVVPNPYDPEKPSIFRDWKAHGPVNVSSALAVSSNVFFYQVGGGFNSQKGVGIAKLEEYYRKFGFGEIVPGELNPNHQGIIPNPEWKEKVFDEAWRLGDTYFTSIGQYGMQVTPLQMVRAVGAMASEGVLIEPRIVADETNPPVISRRIELPAENFKVIKGGMRKAVTDGTIQGLKNDFVAVAAKTGTAELGVTREKVNSWLTGFFPYQKPRYAFALVLEKGDLYPKMGSVFTTRQLLDWMSVNTPEYFLTD